VAAFSASGGAKIPPEAKTLYNIYEPLQRQNENCLGEININKY
jgi:hypothetical protein